VPERYVIGLGANLGDAEATLREAVAALPGVVAVSSLWATAPVGGPAQPDFLNAAARLEVELDPPALLAVLQAIERDAGRVRGVRWGPRILDLDILLWGGGIVAEPALAIPHPRLAERLFAIEPLLEVDPGVLPDGRSLRTIARTLDQRVRRLGPLGIDTIGTATRNEG
jgi:2-amino-4-hydroxy-6-hydroxymethyldihydropteridine diphosphokinase